MTGAHDLILDSCLAADTGLVTLADKSIDAVITDPPFDMRTHRAGARARSEHALDFEPLRHEDIRELARQFTRVCRGWIVAFCGERQIETWAALLETAGATYHGLGLALRTNPAPRMDGRGPAVAADPIVIAWAGPGSREWNGGGKPARWDSGPARYDDCGQVHPTQKPLALMKRLLEDFTDPGEVVLDPFAGSGTTAVACKRLGRRFIGWELSPAYHEIAQRRITDAREQLRLAELKPRDQQPGLFEVRPEA